MILKDISGSRSDSEMQDVRSCLVVIFMWLLAAEGIGDWMTRGTLACLAKGLNWVRRVVSVGCIHCESSVRVRELLSRTEKKGQHGRVRQLVMRRGSGNWAGSWSRNGI